MKARGCWFTSVLGALVFAGVVLGCDARALNPSPEDPGETEEQSPLPDPRGGGFFTPDESSGDPGGAEVPPVMPPPSGGPVSVSSPDAGATSFAVPDDDGGDLDDEGADGGAGH